MRILAIDYGDSRTGVALSDLTGSMAGRAFTLKETSMRRLADKLTELIKENDVQTVVIGYPKNMDGSLGKRAELSEALADLIREKTGMSPVLWDERRTTVESHQILNTTNTRGTKRKTVIDAVAASLILEGYLSYISKNQQDNCGR